MRDLHINYHRLFLSLIFTLFTFSWVQAETVHPSSVTEDVSVNYGELPLYFERNLGQTDERVHYLARTGSHTLFLTQERMVFNLALDVPHGNNLLALEDTPQIDEVRRQYGLFVDFIGANPTPTLHAENPHESVSSYFIGNDASQWVAGAPHFGAVRYEALYDGIDAIFYGNQSRLQYDFIVAPYADPAQIQLRFDPAEQIRLTGTGDLELSLGELIFTMQAPYSYQTINGVEREVASHFILEDGTVRFVLGDYDPSHTLIIDPLVYSTYLGGSSSEIGYTIAVDNSGHAYIIGLTLSTNFPTTTGAVQTAFAGGFFENFVTKLNPAGDDLIYSTYLGGTGDDRGYGIAVDSGGHAYVTGSTTSTDFPMQNAYQPVYPASTRAAFVTKINPAGDNLVYSTYLGGDGSDIGRSIAIDSTGHAYIAGETSSTDFPTQNAYESTLPGGIVAFVTKINPAGDDLIYSTYLGGSDGNDRGYSIAIDSTNHAYITGLVNSTDFPTTVGTFQTTNPGVTSTFVTKLNQTGDDLIYSTYLGGGSIDIGNGIAVDSSGHAYVTGETLSTNFPTTGGAIQTTHIGDYDVFVTKVNLIGTGLIYSTYLGGSNSDKSNGIALDSSGHAYVTGETSSTDFPTTGSAFQTTHAGIEDVFVTKVNPTGTGLIYSTYLGGSNSDKSNGIALDSSGHAYVTGETGSTDFPIQNPYQPTNVSQSAFVTKILMSAPPPPAPPPADDAGNTGGTGNASAPQLILSGLGVAGVQGQGIPRPGENAQWQFSIFNNTDAPVNGITARVTYPDDDLQGISANASNGVNGVFSQGSLLVDYNLGTIGAGETIMLNIVTRLPNRAGIFTGTLTVNASPDSATLSLLTVSQLPNTGETPSWAVLIRQLFGLE